MAINVRKLGHALGAEVSGVDISRPIDHQTFSEINREFLDIVCSYFTTSR